MECTGSLTVPWGLGDAVLNFLPSSLCSWVYVCVCRLNTLITARGNAGENKCKEFVSLEKGSLVKTIHLVFQIHILFPFLIENFYFLTSPLIKAVYETSHSKGIKIIHLLGKPIKMKTPN